MDKWDIVQTAYLGTFLLAVLWRILSLWKRGVRPLRLRPGRRDTDNRDTLLLFLGVNAWIAVVLDRILGTGLIPPDAWWRYRLIDGVALRIWGLVLQGMGLCLFIRALHDLGASWRLGTDVDHPGILVDTGIYRLTRNPIYLFFNLLFLGAFFLYGDVILLLLGLGLGFLLHRLVLREERILGQIYGAEYAHYRAATNRYVTLRLGWAWVRGCHQRLLRRWEQARID
jgi:protein-S-isoprenylcysteine O-methyltransferase Ste14